MRTHSPLHNGSMPIPPRYLLTQSSLEQATVPSPPPASPQFWCPPQIPQALPSSAGPTYFWKPVAFLWGCSLLSGDSLPKKLLALKPCSELGARGTQTKTRLSVCLSCTPEGEPWGVQAQFLHSLPWVAGGVLSSSLPVPSVKGALPHAVA